MELYYVKFKELNTKEVRAWARDREEDVVIVSTAVFAKSMMVDATTQGMSKFKARFASVLLSVTKDGCSEMKLE